MYANRYDPSRASRPISAGAALIVNGALVAGLMFAAPEVVKQGKDKIFKTTHIPITPPPPDPEPQRETRKAVALPTTPPIHQPLPVVPLPPSGPVVGTTNDPVRPSYDPPAGAGPGGIAADPPVAPPVLVDSSIDPRHARNFQPDYPASELRMEREGVVRVRIRIGVDGRVKAVERIASPSDAFFESTRRHALGQWRFRPATRDGIPVESWKEMTVRFRIQG